jgi:serine/threonine-protein kinase
MNSFDTLREALAAQYELERALARGGMSEVLLARDVKHGRRVALKVMSPEVAGNIGTERFLREIQLAARLTHPHILPLLDSGFAAGRPYYVMPYVDGESVRQRLDRLGRLPIDDAVSITREVADALDYAHAAGVLHRDVKPENVLMLSGHAVVMDFGIARAISAATEPTDSTPTSAGLAVGTPAYMSPEQAAGEAIIDGRSDQYSLAIMLFEMLAGEKPFRGPTAQAVIARRFIDTPPSLDTVRAEVPPHIAQAVRRALSAEPENRFPSAGEFAQALAAPSGLAFEPPPRPEPQSIAVLPFANVGGNPENEFLADGITDEVITALSRLRTMRVAARTSSYAMRGRNEDVATVGERLKVTVILEGSVQRVDQRIRVAARLVNVRDGFQFWSEQFDRQLDDVFAIQDEISSAIVRTLKATLLGEGHVSSSAPRSTSVDAYELYLKGRFFWAKRTESNLERAVEHFSSALAKDPNYAPAFAGLADAYAVLGTYGARPPGEVMPLARENARRALALDPALVEAHAALALTLAAYDRDWNGAEAEFKRAITIAPDYSTARQWYAVALLAPRRRFAEALAEIERARSLDPLSLAIASTAGIVRSFARHHDTAIAALSDALALEPGFGMGHFFLGQAYSNAGRAAEAAASAERAIALTGGTPEMLALLAHAKVTVGDRGRAEELLEELLRMGERRYVSSALLAQVRIGLGRHAEAMEDLERACAAGDPEILYLDVRPVYEPLRESDAFRSLLERAGFGA